MIASKFVVKNRTILSTTESKKRFFDISQLKRVLQFTRPYRRKFYWFYCISYCIGCYLLLFGPGLIQHTVDIYIAGKDYNWLIYITIIQIAFLIVETGLRFYFSYTTSWLGQSVVKDMRVKVLEKCSSKPSPV